MNLPFFSDLDGARSILIAGAGGGFDVFCGLPLYASLKRAGRIVHLANLLGMYWSFRLDGVARRNLYLDRIRETETAAEVALEIEKFRDSLPNIRPWTTIPC